MPVEQGWASPARQPPLLPDPRCFLGRCLQTPPYPSNSHSPTPPRRSVPCWPSRSPEASCPLLLPTAPTGPLSCVRRELGAPRSSRPRRMPGPASLPAYVSRAARAGGGDWPGLTRGIYPEALVSGGYVSQSDGTAYVCPGCVSRKLALGQSTGILSLATGVAAATASPKTREHSGASGRSQRGGRLKAAMGWCLPKSRAWGNAGGRTASRPAAKFRATGWTAKAGKEDPAVPAAEETGDGTGALQDLFPCLRGCV